MSKLKEPDDLLIPQTDTLNVDEFDDELNDETFGDPVADDWESAQDLYNDKVETCIRELQKVIGDRVSEIDLKIAASKSNYNFEVALSALLSDEQYNTQRKPLELPKSLDVTSNAANGLITNNIHNLEEQHDLAQIERSLLHESDLMKSDLDRIASQQQFNQMQYQLMQQMQQQQLQPQEMVNQQLLQLPPHLRMIAYQALMNPFNPELQSPHSNHLLNPQAQFIPPHIQQLLQQHQQQQHQQQQQLQNNSLGTPSLNDSFASMNLKVASNHLDHHNVFDSRNLNNLTSNLRSHFLAEQLNQQQQLLNNGKSACVMNGANTESTPVKRALTLEEIEQGLLEEKKAIGIEDSSKRMTLEDLESSFLHDLKVSPKEESSSFGINLNNLNEFPTLDSNEFPKITKTIHEVEKPTLQQQQQAHQFNNQRPNYNNKPQNHNYHSNQHHHHQNYNNNNNNNQRDRNPNFRNYHPSLIPNPLNPLEMIRNDSMNNANKNGYNNKPQQPYQKNYNNNNGHRNYQKLSGYDDYLLSKSDDEYAGIMTPKDINWLRRIQHMQLDFDDPYVQDYYFVNYQTRKIAAELKKRDKANGEMHSVPQLVIPERGKLSSNESTIENPRYIPPDFSGSLGKIRVANVNYPRKLLDFNNKLEKMASKNESVNLEPTGRTEMNKFRRLLLDIERNLTNVLKIDHEDKKIAALPHDAQIPHLEERKRLCDELFNGILTTDDNKNVNFNIANIRKGCMLIFKALQVLEDPAQKTVIISDLLKVDNFHYVVMQKDKTLYCLDYGQVLIDAIKTIKNCDFSLLLNVADGLDDASVVAKFQCGQEIIEVLLTQYTHFDVQDKNQKLAWLAFLERVLEDVDDIPHLRKLCNDHIVALTGQ